MVPSLRCVAVTAITASMAVAQTVSVVVPAAMTIRETMYVEEWDAAGLWAHL